MVRCRECGKEVEAGSKNLRLCLECGQKDEEKKQILKEEYVCVICGESYSSKYSYCMNCGAELSKGELIENTGLTSQKISSQPSTREEMAVCTFCGEIYGINHSYCMNCGNKLSIRKIVNMRKPIHRKTPQSGFTLLKEKKYGYTLLIIGFCILIFLLPVFLNRIHLDFLEGSVENTKLQWSRTYGGVEMDVANSLLQTADGGFALAGFTESYGAGSSDMWLVKTDVNGLMQWNQTYGGVGIDVVFSLLQTSDSGYSLSGFTNSSGAGDNDMWLVKTDVNGIVQWNKTYGGSGIEMCLSHLQTNDEGYALGGYTNSFGAGGNDIWLVKTDSNGVTEWNQTYGGLETESAYDLLQTIDGGYALVGSTNSTGSGGHELWLVKTDSNGVTEWNQTYEGVMLQYEGIFEFGVSALQIMNGNYILLCYNQSKDPYFDLYNLMLIGTDVNGNILWNRTFKGLFTLPLPFVRGTPLIQTLDGGFAIAGVTSVGEIGELDSLSVTIVKTDNNGMIQWNRTWQEEEEEVYLVSCILQTTNEDFILAGIVFYIPDDPGRLFDLDFWIGNLVINTDQISGLEILPILIAFSIMSKYCKKEITSIS